jgi:hypothetical protein
MEGDDWFVTVCDLSFSCPVSRNYKVIRLISLTNRPAHNIKKNDHWSDLISTGIMEYTMMGKHPCVIHKYRQ